MNSYNVLLTIIALCTAFYGMYYFFAVIFIHRKIFDKYFYFVIASLVMTVYEVCQILQTFHLQDEYLLIIHRVKVILVIFGSALLLLMLYKIYFLNAKKYLANFMLIISLPLMILINTEYGLSYPINAIHVTAFWQEMTFYNATSNIAYTIWNICMLVTYIISIIYYFLLKDCKKRPQFIILIVLGILSALNDWGVVHQLVNNFMIVSLFVGTFLGFIFVDFLLDDRKKHFDLLDLSKQLQKEKDEVTELSKELEKEKDQAIHRLHIMEIYTRRSLVEAIERGDDPTKFVSKNVQITTLFSDIRDFTGISEGLKPLEVVELLNSYFNRMNSSIIKHKGEIDKLIGDCIMALFKNPDDALRSAIDIRIELSRFNDETKDVLHLPDVVQLIKFEELR